MNYLPFPNGNNNNINENSDDKKFINDNIYIFDTIKMKSAEIIMNKFDEKIKNKEIIVYNEDTFYRNILKIGRIFTSQKYLNYLKDNEMQEIQNNILVINVENLNINKLINRFLNLSENENDSLDPKEYNGLRNNKKYNLFKINGVSKPYSKMIDKIFNLDHPNSSIHCIWYCFQGKNINNIDKQYIKALLLSVYDTQKISIIFINFKKSNNYSNDECKKVFKKYLNEIYNNDHDKVNELLKNYIVINGNNYSSLDLNNLEKTTLNDIKAKGFDPIDRKIAQVFINGCFDLKIPEFINKTLTEYSINNPDKYLNYLLDIISDDKLELNNENNKKNIKDIYSIFISIKNSLKIELKHKLGTERLILENEEMINKYYLKKTEDYKNKIDLDNYHKKVKKLIYEQINYNSDKIIQSLLNICFHSFIIKIVKETIYNKFNEYKTQIIKEINAKLIIEEIQNSIISNNNNTRINPIRNNNNIRENNNNNNEIKNISRKGKSINTNKRLNIKNDNNISNYKIKNNNSFINDKNNIKKNIFQIKDKSAPKINLEESENNSKNQNKNNKSKEHFKRNIDNDQYQIYYATKYITKGNNYINSNRSRITINTSNENEKNNIENFEKKLIQANHENKFLERSISPYIKSRQESNNSTNNNSSYIFRKIETNNGCKSTKNINTKICLSKSIYKSNKNEIEEKFIYKKNNKLKKSAMENIEKNKSDKVRNYSSHKSSILQNEIKNNIIFEKKSIIDWNISSTTRKNENNIYFRNDGNTKYINNFKKKLNLDDNIKIIYNKPIYLPTKINKIIVEEVKIKEPIAFCDDDKNK